MTGWALIKSTARRGAGAWRKSAITRESGDTGQSEIMKTKFLEQIFKGG
jgi:hypothetical protein